jgi:hypothetical protein
LKECGAKTISRVERLLRGAFLVINISECFSLDALPYRDGAACHAHEFFSEKVSFRKKRPRERPRERNKGSAIFG